MPLRSLYSRRPRLPPALSLASTSSPSLGGTGTTQITQVGMNAARGVTPTIKVNQINVKKLSVAA